MSVKTLNRVADCYDIRRLNLALRELGHYVYGYFRPGEHMPFYVGKGSGDRVVSHWKNALSGDISYKQYEEIRFSGGTPVIKILSYNLEQTKKQDVRDVVERTLQSAFGIQERIEKLPGTNRLKELKGILVQKRNDGRHHPVLSLEAAFVRAAQRANAVSNFDLPKLCGDRSVLLVGLSKTYHPGYSDLDLREMARMWWNLDKLKKNFSSLISQKDAVLAAWDSSLTGFPVIVGAWAIKFGSFKKDINGERCSCTLIEDIEVKRNLLGQALSETGNQLQGPRICLSNRLN